jgi:hypothetical protein
MDSQQGKGQFPQQGLGLLQQAGAGSAGLDVPPHSLAVPAGRGAVRGFSPAFLVTLAAGFRFAALCFRYSEYPPTAAAASMTRAKIATFGQVVFFGAQQSASGEPSPEQSSCPAHSPSS